MKINSRLLIKYIIVGAVMSIVVFTLRKAAFSVDAPANQTKIQTIMQYLSDSTIIPGIILMIFYGLAWSTNEGTFDGIGYAGRFIGAMFIPNLKMYRGKDGFYEYKKQKSEKRTKQLTKESLFVGIGFFILGIVFYILYCVL